MKGITKITVTMHGLDAEKASAGWESGGARFHVWFDPVTRTVVPGYAFGKSDAKLIYKNPLVDHGHGYFKTRQLDATSPGNVAILEHVFETINREGLIAKARIAAKEAAIAEEKKRKQDAIDHRVDEFRKLLPFLKEQARDEMIIALSDELSLDDLDELRARFP